MVNLLNMVQNCSVLGDSMNKEELMKILPHRDNMLLLDEAEK